MTKQTFLQRNQVTPKKMVLIGVLAIVLVGVIVYQLPWGEKNPYQGPVAREDAASQPATREENIRPRTDSHQRRERPTSPPWPEIPLPVVVQYDPFALPSWAVPESDTQQAPEQEAQVNAAEPVVATSDFLTEIQEGGVAAVTYAEGKVAAIIGSSRVGIGDVLNGYRVVEINRSGVVLVVDEAP